MKALNLYALCTILFVIVSVLLFTSIEEHEHKAVQVGQVGITPVYVEICYTDSLQVLPSGKHIESRRNTQYWNGGFAR